MNAVVVYDSKFGNTERIARQVGEVFGEHFSVKILSVADRPRLSSQGTDLLVIGAPTQRRKVSETMRTFLSEVPRGALRGLRVAAFDTRYPGASWRTGLAALGIAMLLRRKGAQLIAAPESFFMERDVPPQGQKRRHDIEQLKPGKAQRAAAWARTLLEAVGVHA